MKNKILSIILPIIVIIISLYLLKSLLPEFSPNGGMDLKYNDKQIREKAIRDLKILNVKTDDNSILLSLQKNKSLVSWIQDTHQLDRANKIISELNGAYYWKVQYSLESSFKINVDNESENPNEKPEDLTMNYSTDGKLLRFEKSVPDSEVTGESSVESVKSNAVKFLKDVRKDLNIQLDNLKKNDPDKGFIIDLVETIKAQKRTDYAVVLKKNNPLTDEPTRLRIEFAGNKVKLFEISEIIPEKYLGNDERIYSIIAVILYLLIVTVWVSFIGFKRFRAYEIGFRQAIIIGSIIVLSMILKFFLPEYLNIRIELIIGLVLGSIFIGGAAIILWAVSETYFREVWNEKFYSFDLVFNGYLNQSSVGKAILNGIAAGTTIVTFIFICFAVLKNYFYFFFPEDGFNQLSQFTATIPSLQLVADTIASQAMMGISFFVFIVAAFRRIFTNKAALILVPALTLGLFLNSGIYPVSAGIPIQVIIGIILLIILVNFDLLSTFIAFFTYGFFLRASDFLVGGNTYFMEPWNNTIIFLSVIIILCAIIILTKDKVIDYHSITPSFVANITERERLKKELEVARIVQMSFLPKSNPVFENLDIASICIPANEVGGDYYDFIQLSDKKLGIIIGDVSGKGTQAAFYMTLAKGFIKATAKGTDSPAKVLIKMNELFYENVERGRFISMVYAIVDIEKNILRIARAGHNPVIMHDSIGKVNLINPQGLALGLEKGPLFERVITETEELLEKGKVFIFYTDGFTEAVNKSGQEYGLEKILSLAQEQASETAAAIQDKIIDDIKSFTGKAPQHDDMTMVVLKIN